MKTKQELKREGKREQPTLPVPRVVPHTMPSAYLKGRPDDVVILEVLRMVEFILIPKALHGREKIRVYFVKDEEGRWHWAHRGRRDSDDAEMWVNNQSIVAPSGKCAFYFHEQLLAEHEIKGEFSAPGKEPERAKAMQRRDHYAALIAEELETANLRRS